MFTETPGRRAYQVRYTEADIQYEIMDNGPVSADMDMYQDFLHYRSGE